MRLGITHTEIDELAIGRNLTALVKSGGGMVVAEKGALVGCCSWAIVPTVQHGVLGRITILIVDADHRRRGVGSAMLQAATDALRKEGCTSVEVMSDIEIAHSHGFFRARKFEQTSYRFARKLEDPQ
jgi:ribosomal protein S18 acetylase RimI-like enzyme